MKDSIDLYIDDLMKENEHQRELGLALYAALYEHLENHGAIDNVPSAIDQLVGKDCGEYANMYNEYKILKKELQNLESDHNLLIDAKEQQYNDLVKQIRHESDARKILVKELALYKKALELACYYMEYKYSKKNDDIYYRKARELEMIFLEQAKEQLNE